MRPSTAVSLTMAASCDLSCWFSLVSSSFSRVRLAISALSSLSAVTCELEAVGVGERL